jgi:hypothetical protein
MANRFFNLQPTQYVDPYVAPPVEMLYNMLQQKQAGYDKVMTNLDDTDSMIKGDVIPGDQASYKSIKDSYNSKAEKIRDDLMNSKNTSQAARDIMKLRKQIAGDSNLQNMFAAYKSWEEEYKSYQQAARENKLQSWNILENPLTVTTFDPETGSHINRRFRFHTNAHELDKEAKAFIGNIAEDGDIKQLQGLGHIKIDELGRVISTKSGWSGVGINKLNQVVDPKAIDWLYTKPGQEFARMKAEEFKNAGKELTDEELLNQSKAFLKRSVLNQVGMKTEKTESAQFLPERILDKINLEPGTPVDDIVIDIDESSILTDNDLTTTNFLQKLSNMGTIGQSDKLYSDKKYSELSPKVKKDFDMFLETFYDKNTIQDIKENKKRASDYYDNFKKYYNIINMKQDTNVQSIAIDSKQGFFELGLGKRESVNGAEIQNALGLSGETLVYSVKDKKFIPAKDIKSKDDNQNISYRITQETTPTNPFYLKSGEDPKYAKAFKIIGTDGNAYFIPGNLKKGTEQYDTNIMMAEISKAKKFNGMPINLNFSDFKNHKIRYDQDGVYRVTKGNSTEIVAAGQTEAEVLNSLSVYNKYK